MLDFAGRMRKGLLLGALLVLARVLAGAAERDIPVSPEAAEAFNAARRLQQTGDAASAEREFVRALRHTGRARRRHVCQIRSITIAGAMPPAAHMVTRPRVWSRRSSSSSTVPMSSEPVAPIG